jgi:hypothetical protein
VPGEQEQEGEDDEDGRDQARASHHPPPSQLSPANAHRYISARSVACVQPAVSSGKIPSVFDRFKTGPALAAVGALLLIVGGVIVVVRGGFVGTAIAAVGGLIVVRERMSRR